MKSILTKVLLGFCIAAPAMARLPISTGKLGGIVIRHNGLSPTQQRAAKHGFGIWLQNMLYNLPNQPRSGSFQLATSESDQNYAATITFQMQTTQAPDPCLIGHAMDECGIRILGADGVSRKITVNIYPTILREGRTYALPLNDPGYFQNAMIRTAGRILGVDLSMYDNSRQSQFVGIDKDADMSTWITLPTAEEYAEVARIYDLDHAGTPDASISIVEFLTYNTAGINDGAEQRQSSPGLKLPTSRYRLQSARWVAAKPTPNAYIAGWQRAASKADGRISVPGKTTCYPSTNPVEYFSFYGLPSGEASGLQYLVQAGAQLQIMNVLSSSARDILIAPAPVSCITPIGFAVDLMYGQ